MVSSTATDGFDVIDLQNSLLAAVHASASLFAMKLDYISRGKGSSGFLHACSPAMEARGPGCSMFLRVILDPFLLGLAVALGILCAPFLVAGSILLAISFAVFLLSLSFALWILLAPFIAARAVALQPRWVGRRLFAQSLSLFIRGTANATVVDDSPGSRVAVRAWLAGKVRGLASILRGVSCDNLHTDTLCGSDFRNNYTVGR